MLKSGVLFFVYLYLSVSKVWAQPESYSTLLNRYNQATDTENYDAALPLTFNMQATAAGRYGKHSWQYIRALNATGYVFKKTGKIDSALWFFQTGYVLATAGKVPDSTIYRLIVNLADCHIVKKNKDSASYYTALAMESLKRQHGENSESYIDNACHLANNLWDIDTATAHRYYTGTLNAIKQISGNSSCIVTQQLLRLDDAIYTADSRYYADYLGSRKERIQTIFTYTTFKEHSLEKCKVEFRDAIGNNDYQTAFAWGMMALHKSLRYPNDAQVAEITALLSYLYAHYYQVRPFADFFQQVFLPTERARSRFDIEPYTNPPEKYVRDMRFVTNTSAGRNDLQLVVPIGHTLQVNTLAFSPDKKYLLSASFDKSAKIWEVSTGKLIVSLNHDTPVEKAAYSPDGKYILTRPQPTDSSRTIMIWSSRGKLLKTLSTKISYINNASFSPDSKAILVACGDSKARLFAIESEKLLLVLPYGSNHQAEFSSDGKYIFTYNENSSVHIWNAVTGKHLGQVRDASEKYLINSITISQSGKYFALTWFDKIQVFDTQTQKPVSLINYRQNTNLDKIKCTFSPDDQEILACAFTNSVKVFEVKSGNFLRELSTTTPVSAAAYHPDGKNILVGQENLTVIDKQSGEPVSRFKGHTTYADNYDLSPDGKDVVIPDRDGRARIWGIATAKLRSVLSGHHAWIWKSQYSADGKYIATCSFDSTARIWEAATGRIVSVLKGHRACVRAVDFHPAGKTVITAGDDNRAILWDMATGKLIDSVRFSKNKYGGNIARQNAFVQFNKDGTLFVTATEIDSVVKIWDTHSRRLLHTLTGHKNITTNVTVSNNRRQVLTVSLDSTARLWDLRTGKLIREIIIGQAINRGFYSPDDSMFVLAGQKDLMVFDALTGKQLSTFKNQNKVRNAFISTDGKTILTDGWNNRISLLNIITGKPLYESKVDAGYMVNARFSKDEKKIIGVCGDGSIKIWDTATGLQRYSFFPVDSAGYFIQAPSGYYQSTQDAAKLLHYVTSDMKVVTFDQLDLKYNRPDKVQEAMGSTDTALVKAYRLAYNKRIRKMGVDTNQFRSGYSVPEADFKNRASINYKQAQSTLTLHITGRDSAYLLNRMNVWVNASPVFGQRGISLKWRKSHVIDTLINIQLSDGENRIEASVTNSNGAESYRMPVQVNYEPLSPSISKLYFIGIGIDRFEDMRYNLKWSVKDIRDLALHLKDKYGQAITIDTLFDEEVSVKKIIALKNILKKTGVNDKVIVAYSGHGLLSKDYDYYLSTYKVNFPKPEQNGLPYDLLESLLDDIPARKKLLLIDACHSGEVDKEELQKTAQINERTQKRSGTRGFGDIRRIKGTGVLNSFDLMQSLFVNVGRSTGATVISAAAGTQFALERNELKNGVFTYSILTYMQRHPHASLSALKTFVNRHVSDLTKGAQVPTARSENDIIDWLVW